MVQLRYEGKEAGCRRIRARNSVCYTVIGRQFIKKYIDAIFGDTAYWGNLLSQDSTVSGKVVKNLFTQFIDFDSLKGAELDDEIEADTGAES